MDPKPLRPLVKIHPETGKKTLTIGRHAYKIPGLPDQEARDLVKHLEDFACQEPRTYHHCMDGWRCCDLGQQKPYASSSTMGLN